MSLTASPYRAPCLCRSDLPQCADSIESHPNVPGLFALATYQVDQQEMDREMRGGGGSGDEVDAGDGDGDDDDGDGGASSPPYTRKGMIRLYQSTSASPSPSCNIAFEAHTPAVLDTKWTSDGSALGVADAKGRVSFWSLLHANAASPSLQHLTSWRMNTRRALCLSLDFTRGDDADDLHDSTRMIVSQSDGSLAFVPSVGAAVSASASVSGGGDGGNQRAEEVLREQWARLRGKNGGDEEEEEADNDDDDEEEEEDHQELPNGDDDDDDVSSPSSPSPPLGLETWHAHDYEAWIVAFDPRSDGRVAWSGGDDLALKGWDTRTPCKSHTRTPTFTNRRTFTGGVTTIAPNPHPQREHQWAVGSYDGRLRLFDARFTARPEREVEMPGGVWRLKWHPREGGRVLAGCMHGGFAVVDVDAAPLTEPKAESAAAAAAAAAVAKTTAAGGVAGGGLAGTGKLSPSSSSSSSSSSAAGGVVAGTGQAFPSPSSFPSSSSSSNDAAPRIVTTFDGHDSLAYGCDWERGGSVDDLDDIVYSCSFYDRRLCMWRAARRGRG